MVQIFNITFKNLDEIWLFKYIFKVYILQNFLFNKAKIDDKEFQLLDLNIHINNGKLDPKFYDKRNDLLFHNVNCF